MKLQSGRNCSEPYVVESSQVSSERDEPIAYLKRIRDYYQALWFGAPYEWAQFDEVPFRPLAKPLSQCRVALITTAARFQPDKGDQGPGAPYNARAKFYEVYSGDSSVDHDLRISHIAIDRQHTSAEDIGTYFPLMALRQSADVARIGSVAPRFHGLPTNRSQRVTIEIDCAELVERCVADGVDAAILVPNCPVCHQSVSLAARALEAAGISSVIIGCAKDIIEYVGVPRLVFSDFPLGNGAGRPNDKASQAHTLELALQLLEVATGARTTRQSQLKWFGSSEWKRNYSNASLLSAAQIASRQAEFNASKAEAANIRRDTKERNLPP